MSETNNAEPNNAESKEIRPNDSLKDDGRPTIIFWMVSLLALFWGVFGLIDYYMISTQNPEYLAQLPAKFKDLISGFPLWREVLWYISIGGAFLGGILMLLRSAWAVPFLWAVPLSMIIGFVGYDLLMANGVEAYGTYGLIASTIMIIISLILALYAAGCDEDEILK